MPPNDNEDVTLLHQQLANHNIMLSAATATATATATASKNQPVNVPTSMLPCAEVPSNDEDRVSIEPMDIADDPMDIIDTEGWRSPPPPAEPEAPVQNCVGAPHRVTSTGNKLSRTTSRDWFSDTEEMDLHLDLSPNMFDDYALGSELADILECVPTPPPDNEMGVTPSPMMDFTTPRTLLAEAVSGKVFHGPAGRSENDDNISALRPLKTDEQQLVMDSTSVGDAMVGLSSMDDVALADMIAGMQVPPPPASEPVAEPPSIPSSTTTPPSTTMYAHIKDALTNPPQFCEPTDLDVLFGRGGKSNHHPGNKRYRREVASLQTWYKASAKTEKTDLSTCLVDYITSYGGRFLKLDKTTKQWYQVSKLVARRKASQGLRELEKDEDDVSGEGSVNAESVTAIEQRIGVKRDCHKPEETVKKKFKKK